MAYTSPLVGMLTQESPQYKRNMLASQMLMGQGPAQNPSKSPLEAALRALTQIAGGYIGGQAMRQDEAQRSEAGKMLSDALVGGTTGYQKTSEPWAEVSGITPTVSQPQSRSQLLATLSGSQNPYARQLGQGLTAQTLMQMPSGGGVEGPEKFGAPQMVMGPGGKPVLAQFGTLGTPKIAEGFSPLSEEAAAAAAGPGMAAVKPPTLRDFNVGDKVVTKQWNPATNAWDELATAPRWAPERGPLSTTNITVQAPGMEKVPEAVRTKYTEQRATFAPMQAGLDRLGKMYDKLGSDAWSRAGSAVGVKGPETAAADSLAEALRVQLNVAYGQGAIAEGDYQRAVTILPKLSDMRLGKDALISGVKTVKQILSDAQDANEGRISTTPPSKAPAVVPKVPQAAVPAPTPPVPAITDPTAPAAPTPSGAKKRIRLDASGNIIK